MIYWNGPRWFAIVKPAGIPVFPPHKNPAGDCVLARLLDAQPQQKTMPWPEGFAGGIAHRLDIPTSGLLLVAREPDGLAELRQHFAARTLTKHYRFLTRRTVPWRTHEISREIAHDPKKKKRMAIRRGQNTPHRGQWLQASTTFSDPQPLPGGLTAWRATMHTGVMHQIRLHAAAVGLALAGDRLYGGKETPEGFAAAFALHHEAIVGPEIDPPPLTTPQWWGKTDLR